MLDSQSEERYLKLFSKSQVFFYQTEEDHSSIPWSNTDTERVGFQ